LGNLPYVFTINDFFDKTLDINLTNFRNKSMMKFDPAQAKTITVVHNGKTYVYQKDDKGTWSSNGRTKANEEGVYLMNTLSSTMVTDFASKKDSTGLKNPSYSMEVLLSSGAKRLYRFGNIKANSVYLASDQNKDVYLVPSNMFAQLDTYYSAILTPVAVSSPAAK
jgi:hypothetical protein